MESDAGRSFRADHAAMLTRETAIAQAHRLAPLMRARSGQSKAERKAPDATIAELKGSGLIRLMQPKRYGGFELGRDVACEIVHIFARACGSQAWVYHVLVDHAWMLGTYPPEAQQDVWGRDPDVLMSSSFAPTGRAKGVKDGFVLSGTFGFSSGIDHADWVIAAGVVEEDKQIRHFLLPKADGRVIDDWNVNGLEGTGSKSFETGDVFVPMHRSVPLAQLLQGEGPGTLVNRAPLYRAPRYGFTSAGFAAIVVGLAESLLENWLAHTAKRGGPTRPAAKESMQIAAGQCAVEIETADMIYRRAAREGTRRLEAGEKLAETGNPQISCQIAYAVQLVLGAAMRLYHTAGASMVYRGNAMEQQFRDIMAGVQHSSVNWPTCAAGFGAQLFQNKAVG